MKKFNSLENLKSLLPDDYKSVDKTNSSKKTPLNKQFLEAHYSVKGRAGTPVIIIKGFSLMDKNEIKLISKEIKNKLGIGGSLKNNELYFQGNKRDQIISILARMGHDVKKVGG
jgi:translation initiation factor 1|tara:strand:+ start:479 stop:820 length:342 start_codon:yes stop_codon:yes gene_type:complete